MKSLRGADRETPDEHCYRFVVLNAIKSECYIEGSALSSTSSM
jgi:hypothetical protein